jgi:hypothetical protein
VSCPPQLQALQAMQQQALQKQMLSQQLLMQQQVGRLLSLHLASLWC